MHILLNNLARGGVQNIVWKSILLEGLEDCVWTEVQKE